jgi:hydrogenase/urease accessory protein HupE
MQVYLLRPDNSLPHAAARGFFARRDEPHPPAPDEWFHAARRRAVQRKRRNPMSGFKRAIDALGGRWRARRAAVPRRVALALLLLGAPLYAHDPGISTAQGTLEADAFNLSVSFAPSDAQQLLPPAARSSGRWTQAEFESARDALVKLAPQLWEVHAGDLLLIPRETHVELAPGDALNFHLVYPRPDHPVLILRALKLGDLPSGHREFVIISDARGSALTKKLLSAKDPALEVRLPVVGRVTPNMPSSGDVRAPDGASTMTRPTVEAQTAEPPPTFWGFVWLGVQHIWTGYDHMLFLFALLVVCRSFRSIVAIISCFTLAHSLTLALATLNLVNVPSRFVEPAIAASIVFVGAENLWRRGEEPRGRWALTFAFGLIHGFGFASVLRELGVGRGGQSIAIPLFTFNAGVEIGQITIAAIVLPIVWQLRKRPWFVHRGVMVFSAIVALAGLYWFLERTVFA